MFEDHNNNKKRKQQNKKRNTTKQKKKNKHIADAISFDNWKFRSLTLLIKKKKKISESF